MLQFPHIFESKPALFCYGCGASKPGWFVAIGLHEQLCEGCFRNLIRLALRHDQFKHVLLEPLVNELAGQIREDLQKAIEGFAYREAARVVNVIAAQLLGEPEAKILIGIE